MQMLDELAKILYIPGLETARAAQYVHRYIIILLLETYVSLVPSGRMVGCISMILYLYV